MILPSFRSALPLMLAAPLLNQPVQGQDFSYVSYTPESFMCEAADRNPDEHNVYMLDYSCDSLFGPSSWQKKKADSDVDYDLIIIGAGIGGAYMTNRLIEEFEKKGQEPPKIAIFERAPTVGGRLMSAFGAGPLGLGVSAPNPENVQYPLQEYGGMRIDPYRYPLIYRAVVEEGKRLFGDENCLTVEECLEAYPDDFGVNCCPPMMSPMNVGSVRYATKQPGMGILDESDLSMKAQNYVVDENGRVLSINNLTSIAEGTGSPMDKCTQLVVAADAYFPVDQRGAPWKASIEQLCADCDSSGIEGMCQLCGQFPKPAEAVVSCWGYDKIIDDSLLVSGVITFANEVINANGETFLYLLKHGFQNLVMSLMRRQGELGVAPILQKVFTGLTMGGNEEDVSSLAQAQTELLAEEPQLDSVPSEEQVFTATFTDGSSATARSVYLTMLPYDLPVNSGFEPWEEPLKANAGVNHASKIVLGWKDETKALAAVLGMTPCTPGPCERVILDGAWEDGWLSRQVWLWDSKTIMIYDAGSVVDRAVPSLNTQNAGYNDGMDAVVEKVMAEIRGGLAEGVELEDPDWARLKVWPLGVFVNWNQDNLESIGSSADKISDHLSRPLGYDTAVYYGNSEASSNGGLHGWAEGALVNAEVSLPSLAKYLGLEGEVETPNMEPANVTALIEQSREAAASGDEKFPAEGSEDEPGNLRRVNLGE